MCVESMVVTVSNAIASGAALTKSGAGTVTLAGPNGFTAATINGGTIAGGTLTLSAGATALTSSATSAVNSNVTITMIKDRTHNTIWSHIAADADETADRIIQFVRATTASRQSTR